MFIGNSLGRTVDILHRTMDVSLLRQSVIADNVANADTPHFRRSVVNFETQLRDALESERPPRFQARLTDERHIPFHRPIDYRTVRPVRQLDYFTQTKNNGNNVDIEEETMNQLQNQLIYTLMSNSLNAEFRRVSLVLRG